MASTLHHRAYRRDIEQLAVAVVDNRRPMRAMMRAMLAAIGVGRVEIYESPANALSAMPQTAPDVVIAAGAMQPFGGVELVRFMHRPDSEPLCFVPAMIMSAHAKPDLVAEALQAGAHQVLLLPTSAGTLFRRLDWLMNDERPFELMDDHYVVSGLEEQLALSTPRPTCAPGAVMAAASAVPAAAPHAVKRRAG